MKNSIKLSVLTLAISIFSLAARAQNSTSVPAANTTTTGSGIRISVGPDAGLPIGSFHDNYKSSVGGSVQADFPIVREQLYLTVNAGYDNYFAKNNNTTVNASDLELIPVKVGLKYFPAQNFYIQGEAGASFIANKSDVGADKTASFVYAPQIGYLINVGGKNYIDAGVRFEGNTKFTNTGSSNNILGLRVAYAFEL